MELLRDPRFIGAVAGVGALALLTSLVLLARTLFRWLALRWAASSVRRGNVRRVCSLAGRGLAQGDIARRTGLARDAVALALRMGNVEPPRRQNRPVAERISAPPAPALLPPPAASFSEILATRPLATNASGPPSAAWPLPPSGRVRSGIRTPTRKAAWAS
ncbi:MAG TPA: hypothetical protein VFI96_06065 [Longimicrobiaceae bacterium]|nr:hypothetical protein [Longimicrobiaceae bacterium]